MFVVKVLLSILAFAVCGIPAWIWIAMNNFLQPTGFWQKFVMVGVGLWIGGAVQLFLCIVFIVALVGIWTEL